MNKSKIEWLWDCRAALLDLSETVLNCEDKSAAPRKAQLALELIRRGEESGFVPEGKSESDDGDSAALTVVKVSRLLRFDRWEFLFENIKEVVDKEMVKYTPAYIKLLEERAHRETI